MEKGKGTRRHGRGPRGTAWEGTAGGGQAPGEAGGQARQGRTVMESAVGPSANLDAHILQQPRRASSVAWVLPGFYKEPEEGLYVNAPGLSIW